MKSRGSVGRRCTILSAFVVLAVLASPAGTDAQWPKLSAAELSVPEILEQQREGVGFMSGMGLLVSLNREADVWTRPRLDSLADGMVQLLLDQAVQQPADLLGLLGREGADGRPVGSLEHFLVLVEAAPQIGMTRTGPIRKIGQLYLDDPRAVKLLERVARSSWDEFGKGDRLVAIQSLTRSERGRDVLRRIHREDVLSDPDERHLLRKLARRDFRPDSAGGGGPR